jgi:hypothetical protein
MWCFVDLINLIIIGGVTVALSAAIFFFLTRVNPSDPWPDHYTGSTTEPGLKTMIIIVVGKNNTINLIWRIKLKTIKIVTKRSRKKTKKSKEEWPNWNFYYY